MSAYRAAMSAGSVLTTTADPAIHRGQGVVVERAVPRAHPEGVGQFQQPGGLVRVAGDHGDVVDADRRQAGDRSGGGAAGTEHDAATRHRSQRPSDAVDVGVVGAPSAFGAHQGVGRTHELGAFGPLVGDAQRRELPGHGDRHADPFGAETAYQRREFSSAALDAVVGPVMETQRTVGGQVQLR